MFMKILSLETSAQPGSLALLDGERVVYESIFPAESRTTAVFAVAMDAALREFGRPPSELDLFAVCAGPGSFTGLRIGVTAAKTFAYATGVAVVAVDTLQVIASQIEDSATPLWSVMDAQRQQVYVSLTKEGKTVIPTRIMDVTEWLQSLEAGQMVTGPGLVRCRDRLPSAVTVASDTQWHPRAISLGYVARAQYLSGSRTDFWTLVPKYYRRSAAEEKAGTGEYSGSP
jgi:tRNA threonylcarbamoyladenosine biosynthesis protein TsaB